MTGCASDRAASSPLVHKQAGFAAQPISAPVVPEVTPDKIKTALSGLEKLPADLLKKTGVPGLAIAVVYEDQVVYAKGFGVREAGKPDPVDADTVFQLASVSKPLASTVIAGLVGDRVVKWDDRIIDHDPGFQMHDPAALADQELDGQKISACRDQEKLYGEQKWLKALGEAIAAQDFFLLLWSQRAAQSHFVEFEWSTAIGMRKACAAWHSQTRKDGGSTHAPDNSVHSAFGMQA